MPGPDFGGLVRSLDGVTPPISHHDEQRMIEGPSGLRVWVTITQEDRRRIIGTCPRGWAPVLKDREAGKTVEQLADRYRMTTEEMRTHLSTAYGWVEQQVYKLAEIKAGFRR